MTVYTKIARPYAKATFEYAVEHNEVATWDFFLQKAGMIVKDKRVQELLKNPKIESEKKLAFLIELCNCNEKKAQKNLLAILAKHHRLVVIPSLAGLFNELVKQHNNIIDVTVTTAFPFSLEQQRKLQEALKIRLGKNTEIEVHEDKKLIGGVVIRAGDLVIDASVQGKLKRLRKILVN